MSVVVYATLLAFVASLPSAEGGATAIREGAVFRRGPTYFNLAALLFASVHLAISANAKGGTWAPWIWLFATLTSLWLIGWSFPFAPVLIAVLCLGAELRFSKTAQDFRMQEEARYDEAS